MGQKTVFPLNEKHRSNAETEKQMSGLMDSILKPLSKHSVPDRSKLLDEALTYHSPIERRWVTEHLIICR